MAYPPRGEKRSAETVRVEARRLAKCPAVVRAMEEARERVWARDPELMYADAIRGLHKIGTGKADPGPRLAWQALLREAKSRMKEEKHIRERADLEAFRSAKALLAQVEALEAGGGQRGQSIQHRRSNAAPTEAPPSSPVRKTTIGDHLDDESGQVDARAVESAANREKDELAKVIAERREAARELRSRTESRPRRFVNFGELRLAGN